MPQLAMSMSQMPLCACLLPGLVRSYREHKQHGQQFVLFQRVAKSRRFRSSRTYGQRTVCSEPMAGSTTVREDGVRKNPKRMIRIDPQGLTANDHSSKSRNGLFQRHLSKSSLTPRRNEKFSPDPADIMLG